MAAQVRAARGALERNNGPRRRLRRLGEKRRGGVGCRAAGRDAARRDEKAGFWGKRVSASKTKHTYSFAIGGRLHEVIVDLSKWSGKRTLTVDGEKSKASSGRTP